MNGNVLTYFARNGMLGINADYRLAPEAPWPAGAEDVRGVVRWLKQNARNYGGNPDRIFLFGQSAGATHVATYVFDRRFHSDKGNEVSGAILMSGRYTAGVGSRRSEPRGRRATVLFRQRPRAVRSRSITTHVPNSTIPVMLVMSEHDQPTSSPRLASFSSRSAIATADAVRASSSSSTTITRLRSLTSTQPTTISARRFSSG